MLRLLIEAGASLEAVAEEKPHFSARSKPASSGQRGYCSMLVVIPIIRTPGE